MCRSAASEVEPDASRGACPVPGGEPAARQAPTRGGRYHLARSWTCLQGCVQGRLCRRSCRRTDLKSQSPTPSQGDRPVKPYRPPSDPHPLREKFAAARKELSAALIEREEEIDLVLTALL